MQQLFLQLLSTFFDKFRFPYRRVRRYFILSLIFIIIFLKCLFPYFWDRFHVPLWRYVSVRKDSVVCNISFTWNLNSQIPTSRSRRSSTSISLFYFFMWLRKSYKSRAHWLINVFLLVSLSHHLLILALNILILDVIMGSFFLFIGIQGEKSWSFDFFLKLIDIDQVIILFSHYERKSGDILFCSVEVNHRVLREIGLCYHLEKCNHFINSEKCKESVNQIGWWDKTFDIDPKKVSGTFLQKVEYFLHDFEGQTGEKVDDCEDGVSEDFLDILECGEHHCSYIGFLLDLLILTSQVNIRRLLVDWSHKIVDEEW